MKLLLQYTKVHVRVAIQLYILLQFGLHVSSANESPVVPVNHNPQETCNDKLLTGLASGNNHLAFIGSRGNLPHDVFCKWTFNFNSTNEEIILNVESFFLFEDDSFVIQDMSGTNLFGPYTGYQGNFIIATGNTKFVAILKTSPEKYVSDRSFLVKYSQKECNMELNNAVTGTISSPVYSMTRDVPLSCKYRITGFGASSKSMQSLALTFINFTFDGDSLLTLSNEKITIASNETNFSKKIFGKGNIDLQMDIRVTPQQHYQRFKIIYDVVPDACSGILHINESQPIQKIAFATRDNPENSALTRDVVTCSWRIISLPGTKIQASFSKLQLNSIDEQLVLSSPDNINFHPLLLSSSNSNMFRDKPIISPTNEFWVQFSTPQVVPGSEFLAEFSLFKDHGLNQTSGELTIKETGTHQFRVDENKVVVIMFERKITNGIVMDLYPDLSNSKSHFVTIDNNYPLNWIASPTNELKIVVKQFFNETPLKLKFEAVNRGCNSTLVDPTELFTFNGRCEETRTCFLVLPHDVRISRGLSQYRVHIETIRAHVTVSPIVGNQQPILEIDNLNYRIYEKVDVPLEIGAFVAITPDCQPNDRQLPIVKISYTTEYSCDNDYKLSPGESITITSPDYPNSYPRNSKCHWNIEPTSVADVLYFITFNQFYVEGDDFLRLKSNGNEISLRNPNNDYSMALPEDFIFKSSLEISFESRKVKSSLKSPKFLLRLTAIECGGIETTSTGVISVSTQNTSPLCIWLLTVPLQKGFKYTSIDIHVSGGNNSGVTIYDGESTRNPLLALSKDGTAISSSNKLVVLYEKSKSWSQTPVQIEYEAFGCSEENVCKSGSCMKPEWKCNGINDCGDYSDEISCASATSKATTTSVMTKATTATTSQTKRTNTATTGAPQTTKTTQSQPVITETLTFDPVVSSTSDRPLQQAVVEANNQVSITTMALAIVGAVLVCCTAAFVIGFFVNMRIRKKTGFNRTYFESLSTTNPSYQSDKDIVSI